ncbi:dicarboxylate/amino acid:cation symporter [Fulvivirga sp. M361]|uniref:dicarboxylate/amino acid:cation symporter n=1 Tax=Fulvivirga sp. M361 TaxID=2594266 RepID=UPI00117B2A9F|nr:dicarboxylate/amino acid:cation symporter [Fulvivirga sp. M361]TRX50902.1 dicarboxylate/amino acid:cation symporter [Fulvivirga sp. M361]
MKKLALHTQILIGMTLGLIFGMVCLEFEGLSGFTLDFIKPIGTIFIRSLKMVAVPLVLASLIIGVANIGDVSKLSRMGGKTLGIFVLTTVISITVGLSLVAVMKPGHKLPEETRQNLMSLYDSNAESQISAAEEVKTRGPLQPLIDMVPDNIFFATTQNGRMLQVVFFAILVGVALLQVPKQKGATVLGFFNGINDVIIKIVQYIMLIAPYGVFALIASLIIEIAGDNPEKAWELLYALLWYTITVVIGMFLMMIFVYPILIRYFSKIKYLEFFRGIRPAMLLGFSTSSSTATLPVTMDRVEKQLGVSEEVSSFVLPLGATINMNGTSLYQGVSAIFIAQAMGLELTLSSQITIVLTATLAAVGTAGVPGAGLVMLVIVLEAVGIPAAGIALIMAPERILDMVRTMVNITGDASVAVVVASTEGELDPDFDKKLTTEQSS